MKTHPTIEFIVVVLMYIVAFIMGAAVFIVVWSATPGSRHIEPDDAPFIELPSRMP